MFDLLIKQATIIDGTGKPRWTGDVGVKNGRFTALSHAIESTTAGKTIAGEGLVLAPGFIDIHCHSDDTWLEDPLSEIKLKQGVTLEVVGNCGTSLFPLEPATRDLALADALSDMGKYDNSMDGLSFKDYRGVLEKKGIAINIMGTCRPRYPSYRCHGFFGYAPGCRPDGAYENPSGRGHGPGGRRYVHRTYLCPGNIC